MQPPPADFNLRSLLASAHAQDEPHEPALSADSQWRVIEGDLLLVWLMNVPWMAEKLMAAPRADLSDGCLDLCVVRASGRSQLIKVQ